MTATLTEPRPMTRVTCHVCRRDFAILCDDLRELCDADKRPHCGCKPPPRVKLPGQKLTKCDMLLLVIGAWHVEGTAAVTKEDIIAAAWRANPGAFGLRGYENLYPDSNRVIMELVKMRAQGKVTQPAERLYALTELGRSIFGQLATRAA